MVSQGRHATGTSKAGDRGGKYAKREETLGEEMHHVKKSVLNRLLFGLRTGHDGRRDSGEKHRELLVIPPHRQEPSIRRRFRDITDSVRVGTVGGRRPSGLVGQESVHSGGSYATILPSWMHSLYLCGSCKEGIFSLRLYVVCGDSERRQSTVEL